MIETKENPRFSDQHPSRGEDNGPPDTRPYLCIPYWESPRFAGDPVDIGNIRPLPGDVISWECPAIHTTPYVPGEELEVTVDVRNSGQGNATAIALVVVYWADPTVGFVKPTFFGAVTVAAPTMRNSSVPGVVSATVRGVIPASAPNHVCLVAYVSNSLDQAKGPANPLNDRHWAQRNLIAVAAAASGPMTIPFTAANALATEGQFELRAHSLSPQLLEGLASRRKAEPSEVQPRLQLADAHGRLLSADQQREPAARTRLVLPPNSRSQHSVVLEFDKPITAHELTAIEIGLYKINADHQELVGSLGVVIEGRGQH